MLVRLLAKSPSIWQLLPTFQSFPVVGPSASWSSIRFVNLQRDAKVSVWGHLDAIQHHSPCGFGRRPDLGDGLDAASRQFKINNRLIPNFRILILMSIRQGQVGG